MRRCALLLLAPAAGCRGEGIDPKCREAKTLYIAHQKAAVDRMVPTMTPRQVNEFANRAREEVNRAERQFLAACREMDSGELLACLRTEESMGSADCAPVADELKRRMSPL